MRLVLLNMPYTERRPGSARPKDVKQAKTAELSSYNRGAVALETRQILEQHYGSISERERNDLLLDIIKEFNVWSRNKQVADFKGLNLNQKAEKLKSLIQQELADSDNQAVFPTLQSWLLKLEILCP